MSHEWKMTRIYMHGLLYLPLFLPLNFTSPKSSPKQFLKGRKSLNGPKLKENFNLVKRKRIKRKSFN